jgi:hypothetical protein
MSTPLNPTTHPPTRQPTDHLAHLAARQEERRRQVRGSLWLAATVLLFAILRAISHEGLHRVFGIGWWRLW